MRAPSDKQARRQLWCRFAGAIAAVCTSSVLLVPAGTASAHASVEDIAPADGAVLAESPGSIVVTFSEAMRPDGLLVEVKNSGEQTPPTATAQLDPRDARRVVIELPEVGNGTYQVRLEARDGEDLHMVVARMSFALGEAAPEPSRPISAPAEPIESGARWVVAVGLGLLIGVSVVRRRLEQSGALIDQRSHRVVVWGVSAILVGRLGVLMARALSLGREGLVDHVVTVLSTSDARRSIGIVLALSCVLVLERRGRWRWLDASMPSAIRSTYREAIMVVAIMEVVLIVSWGAHTEFGGGLSPLILASKCAHLVGLGLWVGVLAVVLFVGRGTGARNSALRSVSSVAVFGALLATASGLLLTSRLVVSLTALLSSPYGLMLTIKLTVIMLAVLCGVAMRWHVEHDPASNVARGGSWPVRESALLAVVMVFGAMMATATPAVDPSFLGDADALSDSTTAVAADDLLVQLRAIPNRPGINALEIRIAETRRPSPGKVTAVELSAGRERWSVSGITDGLALIDGVELPAGISEFELVAHRDGIADVAVELTTDAQVPRYVEPRRISDAPIRSALLGFALFVVAASVVVIVDFPRHRRTRRARSRAPLPGSVG